MSRPKGRSSTLLERTLAQIEGTSEAITKRYQNRAPGSPYDVFYSTRKVDGRWHFWRMTPARIRRDAVMAGVTVTVARFIAIQTTGRGRQLGTMEPRIDKLVAAQVTAIKRDDLWKKRRAWRSKKDVEKLDRRKAALEKAAREKSVPGPSPSSESQSPKPDPA